MAMKATALVGLDVHARQTHAAVLDLRSGELGVTRLRMSPIEVVSFLEGLGPASWLSMRPGRPGSGSRVPAASAGSTRAWWLRGRSRRVRAIASRLTVACDARSHACE
jgi:hypothetical protein